MRRVAWSGRGRSEWVVAEGVQSEVQIPLADIDTELQQPFRYFYCPFPSHPTIRPTATVVVPKVVSTHPTLNWGRDVRSGSGEWRHSMTPESWHAAVRYAQSLMPDQLQKVVLSRESIWSGDPVFIQRHIASQPSDTYRLVVQQDPVTGWGALTPEPLCTITDSMIQAEAIAGTTRRGLEAELMASTKNRREQDMVVQWMVAQLSAIGLKPECVGPTPFKLPSIVHLRTDIRAERTGQSVGDILSTLFPTPAVAGVPQDAALELISQLEPPRGWYAGLFGVSSQGKTEVMVVIRMATWSQDGVVFRVGAGIVPASDPSVEWAELNQKLAMVVPNECGPVW